MIGADCELHVLRHVDHHRAGPPGARDIERLVQHFGEIVDVAHQPVVLGAGPGDADGVAFLECVVADQMRRHLPGDAHQRDRIHQRIGQRRHHVGGARPRCYQHHARLSGGTRIALRGVAGALLVSDQNVLDFALLENLVIDRKHRAAGIAEDMLDAMIDQRAHDHRCAGHLVRIVALAHPEQAMSDKSHDPNQMTGAAMVVRALIDHGVKHIFGYPGGAVLPIYDEIFQQSEVEHILVRHEQGAGHAAEGYSRSTGKPGVVLVTSGPGATNMVTPLTDALMDSIPLVCITGQVPTHLIGNDAFQECDTVGITRPCTKHNWLVRDVNDLAKVLHEAFYVASTGRPGPVVVDVPKDVQFAVGTYHPPRKSDVHVSYTPRVKGDAAQIRKAVALLASAKRPIIYTGGGVINSGPEASKLLRELVEATGFPITSTLMGLGAYPASGKNWLGMLGMHGTYEANMSMHDCDVMLCVGARFDDRITGRVDAFSPN